MGQKHPGEFKLRGWLKRRLYRLPIAFFDWRIDGVERWIGVPWILLATRGRRSGRPHRVVLDVLARKAGIHYVQSAYGSHSDWLRNVRANGFLEVEIDRRRFAARLDELGAEVARPIAGEYVRAHPVYARFVGRMLGYRGSLRAKPLAAWIASSFPTLAIAEETWQNREP